MILVSQGKTKIINFTNITRIRIGKYFDEYYIKCDFPNSSYEDLGSYKTEERAKEVLQEIVKFYEDTKQKMMLQDMAILNMVDFDFVYEMPLE